MSLRIGQIKEFNYKSCTTQYQIDSVPELISIRFELY